METGIVAWSVKVTTRGSAFHEPALRLRQLKHARGADIK